MLCLCPMFPVLEKKGRISKLGTKVILEFLSPDGPANINVNIPED